MAVLTGYELALSRQLKAASDVWLNNPRVPREASGTSGMTAAMNGGVNFSTDDGWIPEFAKNNHNAFVLPVTDLSQAIEIQDQDDLRSAYEILNDDIKPLYYRKQNQWMKMVQNSMSEVVPFFDSKRMAHEYYQKLYSE